MYVKDVSISLTLLLNKTHTLEFIMCTYFLGWIISSYNYKICIYNLWKHVMYIEYKYERFFFLDFMFYFLYNFMNVYFVKFKNWAVIEDFFEKSNKTYYQSKIIKFINRLLNNLIHVKLQTFNSWNFTLKCRQKAVNTFTQNLLKSLFSSNFNQA